jgi:DNA polymerase-1
MLVQGEGSRDAKIWLIGEAPGETEEKSGRPFTGGAGRVLEGTMQEVGLKRSEVYIDNVMQIRPPKNDFSVFYQDKSRKIPSQKLLEGHNRLQGLVATHRPNVVVALGNEALFALTGKHQITHWRGSILGCHGVKVVPTIHPAMVMRQYEFRPMVVLDLNRAKRESLTPDFPTPYKDKFILNPTFEQVISTLQFLETQEYVAFDIETGNEQIICIGFGWSKEESICVPIFYSNSSWWTSEEEVAIIKQIRQLFRSKVVKFIAQNAQFDMIYLGDKWGVEVENLWMDTMVAFHCVYPELKKGLGFLCSIYTNRPYYKDMPGQVGTTPDVLWKYNCLDTVVTYECAMEIRKEAEEFGTLSFYQENSHKIIKPLITMQRRGVLIDIKKRKAIDDTLTRDEAEMCQRLHNAVGHDLNPSSPKQMKEFLYDEMKLPPQVDEKSGNLTADEEALEVLFKKFDNPIFKLIQDIRKVRKLLSTYLRAELDPDGRMRCSYVITGTETGRLSSRESVYGRGTNLQNIPRGDIVRSIFIPDEGRLFVNADLSQAEARAVAYLAREERLQNLFEDAKTDIHKRNASMVFSKRVEEVTQDERQLAKTLVHAANYGIGPRKFAKFVGVNEARARDLLNQYYSLYPSIKRWHMEVEATIGKSKIMRTPLGRARMFFGRWGPDLVREAIAYVPQSLVSDIINLGIIKAFPNLPPEWEILLQVHDSILMQVPTDADPEHIKRFIEHYFQIPIEINNRMMVIPIEIKVGKNWANTKKLEV